MTSNARINDCVVEESGLSGWKGVFLCLTEMLLAQKSLQVIYTVFFHEILTLDVFKSKLSSLDVPGT